jgi:hypothetical protein
MSNLREFVRIVESFGQARVLLFEHRHLIRISQKHFSDPFRIVLVAGSRRTGAAATTTDGSAAGNLNLTEVGQPGSNEENVNANAKNVHKNDTFEI